MNHSRISGYCADRMKLRNSDGARGGNGYIYAFDLDKVEIIKTIEKYTSYILRCKKCCHICNPSTTLSHKNCQMCNENFIKFAEVDFYWSQTESYKKWVEKNDL